MGELLGIGKARLVVSSITDDILRGTTNMRLLRNIRRVCPEARVVVTSEHIKQATELYEAGADFVYVPRLYSATEMAAILRDALSHGFPTTTSQLRTTRPLWSLSRRSRARTRASSSANSKGLGR